MKNKEVLESLAKSIKALNNGRLSLFQKLYVKQIEKDLEALDIIKNREIDVKDITDTVDDYELYQAYCEGKGYAEDFICSKDEFWLLREALVDET